MISTQGLTEGRFENYRPVGLFSVSTRFDDSHTEVDKMIDEWLVDQSALLKSQSRLVVNARVTIRLLAGRPKWGEADSIEVRIIGDLCERRPIPNHPNKLPKHRVHRSKR